MVFLIVVGFVVLGPERLKSVLAHAARFKAEWERHRRTIEGQILKELDKPVKHGPQPN